MKIYSAFLSTMKDRGGYWHAFPRHVAQWWRNRAMKTPGDNIERSAIATAAIVDGEIQIKPIRN